MSTAALSVPAPIIPPMDTTDAATLPASVAQRALAQGLWDNARAAHLEANPRWRMLSATPLTQAERDTESQLTPAMARARVLYSPNRGEMYWSPLAPAFFDDPMNRPDMSKKSNAALAAIHNARRANRPITGKIIHRHRRVLMGIGGYIHTVRLDRLAFALTYGAWPDPSCCVTAIVRPDVPDAPPWHINPADTLRADVLIYALAHVAERDGPRVVLGV